MRKVREGHVAWSKEEMELLKVRWPTLREKFNAKDASRELAKEMNRSAGSVMGKARYLQLEK